MSNQSLTPHSIHRQIGTSCSTIKVDSSPEDRHTFYKRKSPSFRKGQPSSWLAVLLEWLLLFKLISQGGVQWLLPTGQEGTGRWGQKSYGPFCLPLFSGLTVFTTRILNPVLPYSCGSSCTKDCCLRPIKYDLSFISAGFQIPSLHKHL